MLDNSNSSGGSDANANALPYVGDKNLRGKSAADVLQIVDGYSEATACGEKSIDQAVAEIGISRSILFELVTLREKLEIADRNGVPVWGPKGINPILKKLRAGKSFDAPEKPVRQASADNASAFTEKSGPRMPAGDALPAPARPDCKKPPVISEPELPPGEKHLSFLPELRGGAEFVPTRQISLEQRGMIVDYYGSLTGYGEKGKFLQRYGLRKELIPIWKDQVRQFRKSLLEHTNNNSGSALSRSVADERDDDDTEDVQQFADGDRTSFTRAYGTRVRSIFDALAMNISDFVPEEIPENFKPTAALPGTGEKLDVLAGRAQAGLPLWHPEDRRSYNDAERD